jgi:hypothetical protein
VQAARLGSSCGVRNGGMKGHSRHRPEEQILTELRLPPVSSGTRAERECMKTIENESFALAGGRRWDSATPLPRF